MLLPSTIESSIERVLFSSLVRLGHVLRRDHFSRIYFGNEFCERLIPSLDNVKQALSIAENQGLNFTLVTPFLTDRGLEKTIPILDYLSKQNETFEVVVNDWGLLRFISKQLPTLKPSLGRLLTKQKRGPRILNFKDKVPDTLIDHFQRSNLDIPAVEEFLKEMRVERVELDNLLQGIKRRTNLKASLYYPYAYITTTRLCLTNSCFDRKIHSRAISPCKMECQKITFRLRHKDMPVDLFLKGNTQFFRNNRFPENTDELGIDRIVYEPDIPMLI